VQNLKKLKIFNITTTKLVAFLSLLIFLFSCTDQGCIEADDFGEYETQTLTVKASASQDRCDYDTTKDLDDPVYQSPEMLTCFGTGGRNADPGGDIIITDYENNTETSTKGCDGFESITHRQICIDSCVQECLMNNSSEINSSYPGWTATDKRSKNINLGVSIKPGANIYITAIGSINLGDTLTYPSFYVSPSNILPHLNEGETGWEDLTSTKFFDVSSGQSLNIRFSGLWTDSDGHIYGAGSNSLGDDPMTDAPIYNGGRRLAVYKIDQPDGYGFDYTQTTEEAGTIGVPLLPDPRAWKCTFNDADDSDQADCVSGKYDDFYPNANNDLVAEVFPISSKAHTEILSSYGGLIRYENDGIQASNYNPFFNINSSTNPNSFCRYLTASDNIECDRINLDGGNSQMLISDVSDLVNDEAVVENKATSSSYEIGLGMLPIIFNGTSNTYSECDNPIIEYWVSDKDNHPINEYQDFDSASGNSTISKKTVTLKTISGPTSFDWSSNNDETAENEVENKISLEPGQKLHVKIEDATVSATDSKTCMKAIAVRFLKYLDIPITKSGFVDFTILSNVPTAECKLNGNPVPLRGRIINPEGKHQDRIIQYEISEDVTGSQELEDDFYEYNYFSTEISMEDTEEDPDPMQSLSVYSINNASSPYSDKVYVRKGQVIRFSPASWLGTFDVDFITEGGTNTVRQTRKCGTAMAMRITPRPALLCRGKAIETVNNPNCVLKFEGSTIIGCEETAPECDNPGDTDYYCDPNSNCRREINCNDPDPSDGQQSCSVGSLPDECSYADTSEELRCEACSDLMADRGSENAKIDTEPLDQCYDLEEYTGKVDNIPDDTGFVSAHAEIGLGAKNLSNFNGYYGNFKEIYDTNTTDDLSYDHTILQTVQPLIFASNGRLAMFVMAGDDFLDMSADYNGDNTQYNGDNGFKISTSGMLTFSNGKWLEAKVCKESEGDSTDCSPKSESEGDPNQFSEVPELVTIADPTSGADEPIVTSPYKFDPYGNLYRVSASDAGGAGKDCTADNSGVETVPGVLFYCHTYEYHSPSQLEDFSDSKKEDIQKKIDRLRITFKIKDPEQPNCKIKDSSSQNDGILVDNPYFLTKTYDDQGNEIDISGTTAGKTCNANDNPGPDEDDCHKQFYCTSIYSNNSGEYAVNVKVKAPTSDGISSMIGNVIHPIIEVMDGKRKNCSTIGDADPNNFDGATRDNPNYDETNPLNDEAVCTTSESQGSAVCYKEYLCDAEDAIGQSERIYKLLIEDERYKAIVNICFVAMFTFYGLGYLMGVSELNQSELMNRIIKVGLIYLFVGEYGWYWFNSFFVNFFKHGSDYMAFLMASSFDESPAIQLAIDKADYYDKSILFSSVDKVFDMVFSDAVLKKISALLFADIFGWLYILIIIAAFLLYVYAVSNAVLLYLTAQVFMSILFTLGPLFFVFLLFNQTKEMFDNWLKQLIGFSLQQIFLLTTLAFFNILMYEVIKIALGYKICWDEVWVLNLLIRVSLLSFWTVASISPRNNSNSAVSSPVDHDGIPSIFSILFIWVIASLMEKFITFMTDLAADISGNLSVSKLAAGVTQAAKGMKQRAGKLASDAYKRSGAKEAVQRADMYLFDSGKMAENRRRQEKAQDRNDRQLKRKLDKGGNDEVSKYKKENGVELSRMSKEQRQEKLDQVRQQAILDTGKKLGLSKEKIEKLQNDKGFKYRGSTILGAAGSAGYQLALGKSTMFKSLNDKKANAAYSTSESKEAIKDMTVGQRDEFAKSGIEVKRSLGGKVLGAGGALRRDWGGLKSVGRGAQRFAKDYSAARNAMMAGKKDTSYMEEMGDTLSEVVEKVAGKGAADIAKVVGWGMGAAAAGTREVGAMAGGVIAAAGLMTGRRAKAAAKMSGATDAIKSARENRKDWNEAKQQLKDEGTIEDTMVQTKEENEAIKKRMQENRKERKTDFDQKFDEGGMAVLQQQIKSANEDDTILEDKGFAQGTLRQIGRGIGNFASKQGARNEAKQNADHYNNKKRAQDISNALEEMNGSEGTLNPVTGEVEGKTRGVIGSIEDDINNNESERQKEIAKARKEKDKFSQGDSGKEEAKEEQELIKQVENAQEAITNPDLTPRQAKEARHNLAVANKALENFNKKSSNSKFAKQEEEINKKYDSHKKHLEAQKQNAEIRANKLGELAEQYNLTSESARGENVEESESSSENAAMAARNKSSITTDNDDISYEEMKELRSRGRSGQNEYDSDSDDDSDSDLDSDAASTIADFNNEDDDDDDIIEINDIDLEETQEGNDPNKTNQ